MYAVVEFVNEGEVAIVPDSWLVGRQKCKWPQWKSTSKIDRAIKQQQEAGSDFKTLPIRIFYETGIWLFMIIGILIACRLKYQG